MTRVAVTKALYAQLEPQIEALAEQGLHLTPETDDIEARCLLLGDAEAASPCLTGQSIPAVVLAGNGSIAAAVRAIKDGATDYLTLPLSTLELAAAIERAISEWRCTAPRQPERAAGVEIIGACPEMRELMRCIEKISLSDAPVLILGESGTGKELVARTIHALSKRRSLPMLTLNCATLPAPMVETELFGKAGAAGEPDHRGLISTAEGGTLFLEEISQLPETAQARLLQVLEDGTLRRPGTTAQVDSDVRILAASHRPLEPLAEQGRFRTDLLYRLNAFPLRIPALRERDGDTRMLAERFLERTVARLGLQRLVFSESALDCMRTYHWPGNVRELENAVERAVILASGATIEPAELGIDALLEQQPARSSSRTDGAYGGVPAPDEGASLEAYFVNFVLEHQDHLTETELAERLGISRKSLWERRQRLNIPRKRTRKRGPRRDHA